ncbi:MAG: hypothetical protein R3Y47_06095 [Lachnospiraceae bacterium]
MTKEQAQEEFLKLLQQWKEEDNKVILEAKEQGTWIGGLDGDRKLFAETKKKYIEKIELLKSMVDET